MLTPAPSLPPGRRRTLRAAPAIFAALAALLFPGDPAVAEWPSEAHRAYWQGQGKAEITRYKLTQSRYGEPRQGDAMMIFVSEPFSRSRHVKLDDWQHAGSDRIDVLKLIATRNFLTGIYPYSLMLSTFTPVDLAQGPQTLKTSMTAQEWCGHTFSQLNLRDGHYEAVRYSYFESDGGDTRARLPVAILEDEIPARIRLAPGKLPTGAFNIIPGGFIARLTHAPLKVEPAAGSYFEPEAARFDPSKIRGYRLTFRTGTDRERVLEYFFEKAFPHAIVAWEDTCAESGGIRLTTRGERTQVMLLDYWKHQANANRELRRQLGLPVDR